MIVGDTRQPRRDPRACSSSRSPRSCRSWCSPRTTAAATRTCSRSRTSRTTATASRCCPRRMQRRSSACAGARRRSARCRGREPRRGRGDRSPSCMRAPAAACTAALARDRRRCSRAHAELIGRSLPDELAGDRSSATPGPHPGRRARRRAARPSAIRRPRSRTPVADRWLAVATTCAREQLVVFSSFAPSDRADAHPAAHLAELLAFARAGGGAAPMRAHRREPDHRRDRARAHRAWLERAPPRRLRRVPARPRRRRSERPAALRPRDRARRQGVRERDRPPATAIACAPSGSPRSAGACTASGRSTGGSIPSARSSAPRCDRRGDRGVAPPPLGPGPHAEGDRRRFEPSRARHGESTAPVSYTADTAKVAVAAEVKRRLERDRRCRRHYARPDRLRLRADRCAAREAARRCASRAARSRSAPMPRPRSRRAAAHPTTCSRRAT